MTLRPGSVRARGLAVEMGAPDVSSDPLPGCSLGMRLVVSGGLWFHPNLSLRTAADWAAGTH
ncbi:MAG TPA: hypothetical protein VHO01_17260 [Jatrophihabitans sp.]|nr:hypothetical protein [Jatrophihabitans sp.]